MYHSPFDRWGPMDAVEGGKAEANLGTPWVLLWV
jgi:hypothetical protein